VEGQSGKQGGHSRDVPVFLSGAVGVAQDHLVDAVRVKPCPVHGFPDYQGCQVVGTDGRKRPAVFAHRRSDPANKESLRTCGCSHGNTLHAINSTVIGGRQSSALTDRSFCK
jgi:hypothetical protein